NAPVQARSVTKVGTTAASFLGIDVGSRGTGMGSAYVSIANDAPAMYWNPAGIARLNNFVATFSTTKWIADLSFNYAGAVLALGNFGNIGANATFLTMDQIERTTILSPDGTGELVDAGSYAVGLSYARSLTDRFSIGFNAKYINERMYHCTAHGFALDLGALFITRLHGLTLGMSISNYGTKMRLDGRDLQIQHDIDPSVYGNNPNINARLRTDNFDLPLMFRVGVSMDVLKGLYDSNLILSVDALHPSDDVESVNLGGEYVFNNMFSLRAGYKELFAKDSEQGLTFGGGIRYNIIGTTTFYFDYSYTDFGVLNAVHIFSVSLVIQ
ncbi:MAG: PorV/PorQ family protein, partial [candidate division KSB1 bacterium]|nr:PorV/PorQ family protein [candidate division KSB1 bacterium]